MSAYVNHCIPTAIVVNCSYGLGSYITGINPWKATLYSLVNLPIRKIAELKFPQYIEKDETNVRKIVPNFIPLVELGIETLSALILLKATGQPLLKVITCIGLNNLGVQIVNGIVEIKRKSNLKISDIFNHLLFPIRTGAVLISAKHLGLRPVDVLGVSGLSVLVFKAQQVVLGLIRKYGL